MKAELSRRQESDAHRFHRQEPGEKQGAPPPQVR